MCLIAVEKNGLLIQKVPHNLKTLEVCEMAKESIILNNGYVNDTLQPYFPKEFKYLVRTKN